MFILFMRFLQRNLISSSFLVLLLRYSFFIFVCFHCCFFDGVRFQYSQVLVSFLFSVRSDLLLIYKFNSFHHLSFSASYCLRSTFSMANSVPIVSMYEDNSISFQTFSYGRLLLIVLTLNSSPPAAMHLLYRSNNFPKAP